MTDFLSVSLCRGRRPRRYSSAHIESRPDIIALLLGKRRVARFLVAPPGYGKTFVAVDYAQKQFNFNQVIWFDCSSTCFRTELSLGSLAEESLHCDDAVRLVVIDGLPRLDAREADEVSRCIDVWLSAGCEVLVTCLPSCDAFARRQVDRLIVKAPDLLIGDASEGKLSVDMVPCVHWGSNHAVDAFVRDASKEQLPLELSCLMLCMFALVEGDLSILSRLLAGREASAATLFLTRYSHFGIDIKQQAFRGVEVPVDCLAASYGRELDVLSRSVGFAGADGLVRFLADRLFLGGRLERAFDLVRLCGSNALKKEWALCRGQETLWKLGLCPLIRLVDSTVIPASVDGARLLLLRACAHALLGDIQISLGLAMRIANLPYSDEPTVLHSLALICRVDDGDERIKAMQQIQKQCLGVPGGSPFHLLCALACGRGDLLKMLSEYAGRATDPRMLDMAACWAFERFPDEVVPYLQVAVKRLDQVDDLDLSGYLVARTCQAAIGKGVIPEHVLSSDVALKLFSTDTQLIKQRAKLNEVLVGRESALASLPAVVESRSQGIGGDIVPLLDVRLFGAVEVRIGGVLVDRRLLSRIKSRVLLVLLCIDAGRELSRDKLMASLWPDGTYENAKRCIYTAWSSLRRALELSDGSCPYLVRTGQGYKIERHLVRTDFDRVQELCDLFRLGVVDELGWLERLAEVERIRAGGLAPGEGCPSLLVAARELVDRKIVDSLMVGSVRLLKQGCSVAALDFAQAAYGEYSTREDVCFALMKAQIACDQRKAALETFFSIRRHLANEMGIDPSARLVRLYRSILEEEGTF